jgi:hypothetical protein
MEGESTHMDNRPLSKEEAVELGKLPQGGLSREHRMVDNLWRFGDPKNMGQYDEKLIRYT